jgi:transcriptional regulator with XRE-family HTH domain
MYTHTQRRSNQSTRELRRKAGRRLRELREKRGLSQREMEQKVGAEHHTFISQLELGRGRIPPDRYLDWADALGVGAREFVCELMSYYDPVTYEIIFAGAPRPPDANDESSSEAINPGHYLRKFFSSLKHSRKVA